MNEITSSYSGQSFFNTNNQLGPSNQFANQSYQFFSQPQAQQQNYTTTPITTQEQYSQPEIDAYNNSEFKFREIPIRPPPE